MLNHISLAFPLQSRTAVQLPGVEPQHRLTVTGRREMQALKVEMATRHQPEQKQLLPNQGKGESYLD